MALTDNRTPTSCQYENESLENDATIESNACKDLTKEKTFDLEPVSPFSSGEGLPYAPEGWPNPGDVWGWKVGRRTNKAGYFHDRYLSLPRSLQSSSRKTGSFQSKPDVKRYIKSNFPNIKIEEFFALFSWKVPKTKQTPTKVKSLETEEVATEEIGTQRKLKRKTQSCSQPTRISFSLFRVRPRLTLDQDANEVIDLCHLNEEERIGATENLRDILDSEEGAGMHTAEEKNPIGNFDDYLGTLEDILAMPHTDITPSDMQEAAFFLSCFKVGGTNSVILEAKGNIKEADKLLADLEEKKFKISSLKIEYIELKDKVTRREAEMDELALNIQEIDDQIQQLQSKRIVSNAYVMTGLLKMVHELG